MYGNSLSFDNSGFTINFSPEGDNMGLLPNQQGQSPAAAGQSGALGGPSAHMGGPQLPAANYGLQTPPMQQFPPY